MSRTEELIAKAQQGDREASEALVEENSGLIWSVARRFLGRGTEADDLYQLGCLGFLKAVEGFDWSNVRFPEGWGRDEMLSLDFVGRAEDLVFHGPTGRGKTHVATALGIEATRRGVPVRFFQTATLVLQLGKAKREGTLDRLLADVGRAGLVILDEFGYVPFDVDGARLLYQVISDSYERRSIVFTTNVEFSRWGTVFADDKLAAAIVDRVVHHGRLVEFGGPSHRLEESLMLGKSGS